MSRASIKVAKKKKKRVPKGKHPKEELVDNCDHCHQKLETGRLRTVGSAICANSNIGDDKTHAIFWKKTNKEDSEWYFFDSRECRAAFKAAHPMPAKPTHEIYENEAGR